MKINERLEIKEVNDSILIDINNYPFLKEMDDSIKGVVEFSIKPLDNKKSNTSVLVPYHGEDFNAFSSELKKRIDIELKKFEFEELNVFEKEKLLTSLPAEVTGSFRANVIREFQPFNPGDGPTTVERVM